MHRAGAVSACGGHYADIVRVQRPALTTHDRTFDFDGVNTVLAEIGRGMDAFFARLDEARRAERERVLRRGALPLPGVGTRRAAADRGAFERTATSRRSRTRSTRVHERVFAVKRARPAVECIYLEGRARRPTWPKPSTCRPGRDAPPARAASHRRTSISATTSRSRRRSSSASSSSRARASTGPAVIEEPTTTIVVYPVAPGHRAARQLVATSSAIALDRSASCSRADDGCRSNATPSTRSGSPSSRTGWTASCARCRTPCCAPARSAVINLARDFSCSIVTGDNRLLAAAEGLPVHVFGSRPPRPRRCASFTPSRGGRRLSPQRRLPRQHPCRPTTRSSCRSSSRASTVHRRGQGASGRHRQLAADDLHAVARGRLRGGRAGLPLRAGPEGLRATCRHRPHVPHAHPRARPWYGDYLAAVGAARIGERRLKEFVRRVRRRVGPGLHRGAGSTTASGAWSRRSSEMPVGRR